MKYDNDGSKTLKGYTFIYFIITKKTLILITHNICTSISENTI